MYFYLVKNKEHFITIINLIIITIFLYSLLTAAIVDNLLISSEDQNLKTVFIKTAKQNVSL